MVRCNTSGLGSRTAIVLKTFPILWDLFCNMRQRLSTCSSQLLPALSRLCVCLCEIYAYLNTDNLHQMPLWTAMPQPLSFPSQFYTPTLSFTILAKVGPLKTNSFFTMFSRPRILPGMLQRVNNCLLIQYIHGNMLVTFFPLS